MVGTLLAGLDALKEPARILMAPDHRTPIALRTHSREPVPFVLWGAGIEADGLGSYSEETAEQGAERLDHGHRMIEMLMG